MANKRILKKKINLICEALFADCVAVSLYGPEANKGNAEAHLYTIVQMHDHYIKRVSHPEPGITAKAYFKDKNVPVHYILMDVTDRAGFVKAADAKEQVEKTAQIDLSQFGGEVPADDFYYGAE